MGNLLVRGKDGGATNICRYEFVVDGRIALGPADFCITRADAADNDGGR